MKKSPPQSPEVLLQLLQEQQKDNVEQQKLIQKLSEQISQMQHRIDQLLHMLYGTKSEKSRPKKKIEHSRQPIVPSKPLHDRPNKRTVRGSYSKELPRVRVKHELPEEERYCQCCHTQLHCMGKVVTEQLDFKPAEFYVKEHVRYKYACRHCEQIHTAPLPPQPVDKGLAGPGLLTEIILNKYQDALPLYRQQQRFARHHIQIPRSTMSDWTQQVASLFEPIVLSMKKDTLLPSRRLFTDDTTVPVLDRAKGGKTHTGRLWVYLGGGSIKPLCALYEYTPTRRATAPKKFLEGYTGYLHADAYPGYDALYTDGNVIEVACWAHARRGFADIIKAAKEPGDANTAMEYIQRLYHIEKVIRHRCIMKRKYYRRRYAKPILKQFKRWLKRKQVKALPKSPIGKAMTYVLNQWDALCNYMREGFLEIDNNTSERAIRPLVLGRKNYLFAGSHEGAKRAAIIYSIIETCKLNDVNPWSYIEDVLTRLPTTLNKDIQSLYPYNWTPRSRRQ